MMRPPENILKRRHVYNPYTDHKDPNTCSEEGCGRPKFQDWTDSGELGATHGFTRPICERHSLEKQIAYVREQVDRLPDLVKRYTEVVAAEDS